MRARSLSILHKPGELENTTPAAPRPLWQRILNPHIKNKPLFPHQLQSNWKSGVTVSLISMPLSVSLAVAAQSTPIMGILTAAWAGLFSSIFGGSDYNIFGPTGALSGILAMNSIIYGVEILPYLAICTGVLCTIIYVFKWDKVFSFVPSAVIHGFTLGVAVVIGGNQMNFAFGLSGLPKHDTWVANAWESLSHMKDMDVPTFLFFSICTVVLLSLILTRPKIPWTIYLSVLGIILGKLSSVDMLFGLKFQTLETKYGELKPVLFSPVPFDTKFLTWDVLKSSAAVTFVAVLETLISAKIADTMTKTRFDQRREVLGCAVANLASGIFGGIPATAALARTALNIKSGATSRVSAFINSLSIIAISLALFPFFKYLPLPVVAAILVCVAIRMVEMHAMTQLWNWDKRMFSLCIACGVICVAVDPTTCILFGVIVAMLIASMEAAKGWSRIVVKRGFEVVAEFHENYDHGHDALVPTHHDTSSRLWHERHPSEYGILHTDTVVYKFEGKLTYVNATIHMDRIKELSDETKIIVLGFRHLHFMDPDGLDGLSQIIQELNEHANEIIIYGAKGDVKKLLVREKWYQEKIAQGHVFESYEQALEYIDNEVEAGGDVQKTPAVDEVPEMVIETADERTSLLSC